MTTRKPFPLDWPAGFPRTKSFEISQSRFKMTSFIHASKAIFQRAKSMHFVNVVISSDISRRLDGLPYADSREPDDRGVAVWWKSALIGGNEQVIACDRWRTVGENLRAIELSLDAMAGLNRWGASQIVKRAFAGFAALPPAAIELPSRNWRDVLFPHGVPKPSGRPGWTPVSPLVMYKNAYRHAMETGHPDRGGSTERAAELNRAWAECQAELERE